MRNKKFDPKIEIFSDASSSGWEAFCGSEKANDFWSETETSFHINYLELLAAFFGLKCFAEKLSNCDVLLGINNTTAIAYINKKSGVRFPKLAKITKDLWQWCEKRNLWIFASYIHSEDNIEADFESHKLEPETRFSLSQSVFEEIISRFGMPEVDLSATRTNTKCKKYFSWKKDPGAMGIDAFTFSWKGYFCYALPPLSIVLRALEKIKFEKSRVILVVP